MRRQHNRFPGFLFILLIGSLILMSGCAPVTETKRPDQSLPTIAEQWGIEILGIHQSAAGYMLDLRYRILDAEKAAPLLHPTVKPYLIDQASGIKLTVPSLPKVGALRQRSSSRPTGSWTSFILFANPGNHIKPADRVTVVIGSLRIEDLVVE